MENKYSNGQLTWLIILRLFVGWHFLFEGMVKVLNPGWSATAYLLDSQGPFRSMFVNMAGNAGLMNVIDFCNQWALVLIGLGLVLGLFTRLSCIGGILLLILYTMSHPALANAQYAMPFEGNYFIIDKNLVELAALGVLFAFPAARLIGMDRLMVRILPEGFQKFII